MTRFQQIVAGLQILASYEPDAEMNAEHDEIFVSGPEPSKLSAVDAAILEEHSFTWDPTLPGWHRFV